MKTKKMATIGGILFFVVLVLFLLLVNNKNNKDNIATEQKSGIEDQSLSIETNESGSVDQTNTITETGGVKKLEDNIQNKFLEEDLVGGIMKQIKLEDFSNLKNKKSEGEKAKNVIKDNLEILEVIHQNLLQIKAVNDNDISYCDKGITYKGQGATIELGYCKGDFYLNQLLMTKNKEICNNFKKGYEDINLMGAEVSAEVMCNKLYALITDKEVNEQKIKDFLTSIYKGGEFDKDSLNIFKTYFLSENFCSEIDTIAGKIKCLNYFYKTDFLNKFKDNVYSELIKSKYLYQ